MNRTRATIIAVAAIVVAGMLGFALRGGGKTAAGEGLSLENGQRLHAPGKGSHPLVAWPTEADAKYQPERKAGESCAVPRRGYIQREAGPGWPATVEEFAAQSEAVVIAVADSQRSWWHQPEASPERVEASNATYGVDPRTATNYRVERVIRGEAPGAIQIDQTGAAPGGDYPCSAWGWAMANDPLAKVGQRYVLFLRRGLGDARFADWGAASRFPVVDDVVFSSLDLEPSAELSFRMGPRALEQFVEEVG